MLYSFKGDFWCCTRTELSPIAIINKVPVTNVHKKKITKSNIIKIGSNKKKVSEFYFTENEICSKTF